MSLVFEHEQPVLQVSVNVNLDLYGAGVDLLGFVKVFQNTVLFKLFSGDRGNVHKGDGFAAPAKLFADVKVLLIGFSDVVGVDNRVVNGSQERGVAAVIRPVGVYHSYFGNGGVPLFGILKILLAELYIVQIHCKSVFVDKACELRFFKIDKVCKRLHRCGDIVFGCESAYLRKRSFAAFHGVDNVGFYSGELLWRKLSLKDINPCVSDPASLALGKYLDTLLAGIGALVELSGKILYRKNGLVFLYFRQPIEAYVYRRLGENIDCRQLKVLLAQPFRVVAVKYANASEPVGTQSRLNIRKQIFRFDGILRFLFNINTID